jgi:branched-chain amino acid transport system ATP-binding protein
MLKISNLNVSYGVIPVLHGVDLEVREGEIVALLGGNGSGKTTLLNAVSGVLKSQSGRITFLGEDIQNRPADTIVQMGIAQIPEGRKIFPYLTVKENLLMGPVPPRPGKNDRQCWRRSASFSRY